MCCYSDFSGNIISLFGFSISLFVFLFCLNISPYALGSLLHLHPLLHSPSMSQSPSNPTRFVLFTDTVPLRVLDHSLNYLFQYFRFPFISLVNNYKNPMYSLLYSIESCLFAISSCVHNNSEDYTQLSYVNVSYEILALTLILRQMCANAHFGAQISWPLENATEKVIQAPGASPGHG